MRCKEQCFVIIKTLFSYQNETDTIAYIFLNWSHKYYYYLSQKIFQLSSLPRILSVVGRIIQNQEEKDVITTQKHFVIKARRNK